jgi:hypothetical protein
MACKLREWQQSHWVLKAHKGAAPKNPIKFAELRLPLAAAANEVSDDRLEVRLPDGTVLRGTLVADVVALVRALRG